MASDRSFRRMNTTVIYEQFNKIDKNNLNTALTLMGRDYMFFKQVPDEYADRELRVVYRDYLLNEEDGIGILVDRFDYKNQSVDIVYLQMINQLLFNVYRAAKPNLVMTKQVQDRFTPINLMKEIQQYWIDHTDMFMRQLEQHGISNTGEKRIEIDQMIRNAISSNLENQHFPHNIVVVYLELNGIGTAQYYIRDNTIELFNQSDIENAKFYIAFMDDDINKQYVMFYTLAQQDNPLPVYHFASPPKI